MAKKLTSDKVLYEGIALAKATQEKINILSNSWAMREKAFHKNANNAFNPIKFDAKKNAYLNYLQTNDATCCASRIVWENLPIYLNSQVLEHYLYKDYWFCFIEKYGKIIPCRIAKSGDLGNLGDLENLQVIGYDGKNHGDYISAEYADKNTEKVAVIFRDFTSYMNLQQASRAAMNRDTLINDMQEILLQIYQNVKLAIKKALSFVETVEQKNSMLSQLDEFFSSTNPFAVIATTKELFSQNMDMFNFENNFDAKAYCDLLDYYYKLLRQMNGIRTADTFNKKERRIGSEVDAIHEATDYVLFDALKSREYSLQQMKYFFKNPDVQKITIKVNEWVGGSEEDKKIEEQNNSKKGNLKNELDGNSI